MLPAALMLGAAAAGLGGALRRPAGDADRDPDRFRQLCKV